MNEISRKVEKLAFNEKRNIALKEKVYIAFLRTSITTVY